MKMSLRSRLELWIEAALSAAEDPQERIRALVRDLRARLDQGRRALGMTIVLEKRLLDELVAAEDAAQAAEALSKEALARGEETAAREAAARMLALRTAVEQARARWQEQRAVADRVRQAYAVAAKRTQKASGFASAPHFTRHNRFLASHTATDGCDPVSTSSTNSNGGCGTYAAPPGPKRRSLASSVGTSCQMRCRVASSGRGPAR